MHIYCFTDRRLYNEIDYLDNEGRAVKNDKMRLTLFRF